MSAGPACEEAREGESVMFSSLSGYVNDLERAGHKVVLRFIHEKEIICGIEGQLEMRDMKSQRETSII